MIPMAKAANFIIPTVLLFLFCWLGPVVGARNKFIPNFVSLGEVQGTITIPPTEAPEMVTNHPGPPSLCEDKVHPLGYKCEDHTVETRDGYLVRLARIPSGGCNESQPNHKAKPAILLQHGVLCDGAMYLLLGNNSLAIYLADNGFDVWIANNRGTKYSTGHKSLNPIQRKYWNWSWDDLTDHELPAMVDYMTNKTGQKKIHYIGHSMGTLTVLAALADRAPVTNHFLSVVLLCPIAHLNHITSPMASIAANIFMGDIGHFFGLPNFDMMSPPVAELVRRFCQLPGVDCSDFVNGFTGQNCCIEPKTMDVYLHHEPQPTSAKTMVHLSQNIRTGVISRFDYGNSKSNEEHYGHSRPPVFRMENISPSIPLYVAYGGLDSLADFVDVELLLRQLKNHDKSKITKKFTLEYAHMDFLMARNANKEVYEPLLPFLKKHK